MSQTPPGFTPPDPPQGHRPQRRARRRHGRGALVAVAVVVLALVLSAGLLAMKYAAERQAAEDQSASMDSHTPTTDTSPPVYRIDERPGWAAMVEYVDGAYQRWHSALLDGTIFDYTPPTAEGASYAEAFVFKLDEINKARTLSPESTDPAELDNRIQGYVDTVAELESKFLAGDDLGFDVTIVNADGTETVYSGEAPDFEPPDPAVLAALEEFAQNFEPQPGADGTYLEAAEQLVQGFGAEIAYTDPDGVGCIVDPVSSVPPPLGYFCSASPDLIVINPEHPSYGTYIYEAGLIDLVRHELAHRQILGHCGTLVAPVAGDRAEGVTNSYAVLYLGADPGALYVEEAYSMDADTDAIAEQIHGGVCG